MLLIGRGNDTFNSVALAFSLGVSVGRGYFQHTNKFLLKEQWKCETITHSIIIKISVTFTVPINSNFDINQSFILRVYLKINFGTFASSPQSLSSHST